MLATACYLLPPEMRDTVDTGAAQALADLTFIGVGGGGVDMPVAEPPSHPAR
jgi:hypothetical protein